MRAKERNDYLKCHALISQEEVQKAKTNELINKVYDGSTNKLLAALLGKKKLTAKQIEGLLVPFSIPSELSMYS